MKVECYPHTKYWPIIPWAPTTKTVEATRSLPFVTTRMSSRIHRVRNVSLHYRLKNDRYVFSHYTVGCWCGQIYANNPALMARPVDAWPVCATCEGRAMAMGLASSEEIVGHELIYTPRCRRSMSELMEDEA